MRPPGPLCPRPLLFLLLISTASSSAENDKEVWRLRSVFSTRFRTAGRSVLASRANAVDALPCDAGNSDSDSARFVVAGHEIDDHGNTDATVMILRTTAECPKETEAVELVDARDDDTAGVSEPANRSSGRPCTVGVVVDDFSHFSGSGWDTAIGVGAGTDGRVFISGGTASMDFSMASAIGPSTAAELRRSFVQDRSGGDATFGAVKGFLALLNLTSRHAIHSNFWGARGETIPAGLAVDADGVGLVVGSMDRPFRDEFFPSSLGDKDEHGGFDAFVVQVAPSGEVQFATTFGGAGGDSAESVAILPGGGCVVVGSTSSQISTSTDWGPSTSTGKSSAFVIVFDRAGIIQRGRVWHGDDDGVAYGKSVVLSRTHMFLVAMVHSTTFPSTTKRYGAHTSTHNLIALLSFPLREEEGPTVLATIGSSESSAATDAVFDDRSHLVHVTGFTKPMGGMQPSDVEPFPMVNSFARAPRKGENTDTAFLVSFNATGTLKQSTVFGGSHFEWGTALARAPPSPKSPGQIIVVGWTESTDFRRQRSILTTGAKETEMAFFAGVMESRT
jgi:hypothetical protein